MNHWSPKQVARAIGVSEASMKRWCDKGLIAVERTAGGHRRIATEAVLAFVKQSKHALKYPELLNLPPSTGRKTSKLDAVGSEIGEVLKRGDLKGFKGMILDLYLTGVPLHTTFDQILAPAFHDLGEAWSNGKISIFEERLACEMCTKLLHDFQEMIGEPAEDAPLALGATLSGDPYSLPTHMVELMLQSLGWRARSLGINLPGETLAEAVATHRPRLFWLSVSTIADETRFRKQFQVLQAACDRVKCWLIVGGRALGAHLRSQLSYTAFCDTVFHLNAFLQGVDGLDGGQGRIASS